MKQATNSETLTFIDFGRFKHSAVLSGENEKNGDARVSENFGHALKVVIDF